MHPTFSGAADEDIDMYTNQCEFTWTEMQIPEADLPRAQVTTLYTGLRGAALDFVRGLEHHTRHSFQALSSRLRDRFQSKNEPDVGTKILHLEQGQRNFEEYVDAGLELCSAAGDVLQPFLIDYWVNGLCNRFAAEDMGDWVRHEREAGQTVTFDQAVRIVKWTQSGVAMTPKYSPTSGILGICEEPKQPAWGNSW